MNSKQNFTCEQARQIDLVDYLNSIGYEPCKIRNNDYWYLSPLREERTASFKINRSINRWYDHGTGNGGNLVDFAILYHNCSIKEFLQSLSGNFSFQESHSNNTKSILAENQIEIVQTNTISSAALLCYLKTRKISFEIASRFCNEVHYKLNEKTYYSIGFKNDKGGYELRNAYYKNSSAPKGITTIKNGAVKIAVFEGFFDFLSFLFLLEKQPPSHWDFCVLNSLSFFEKTRTSLEQYKSIHLFLDNDKAGQNCSFNAVNITKKYVDESGLYKGYKDLNDWLVNFGKNDILNTTHLPP
ncbi:MAG: toprim domain-containing protein [Bacteroidota bacterium]